MQPNGYIPSPPPSQAWHTYWPTHPAQFLLSFPHPELFLYQPNLTGAKVALAASISPTTLALTRGCQLAHAPSLALVTLGWQKYVDLARGLRTKPLWTLWDFWVNMYRIMLFIIFVVNICLCFVGLPPSTANVGQSSVLYRWTKTRWASDSFLQNLCVFPSSNRNVLVERWQASSIACHCYWSHKK